MFDFFQLNEPPFSTAPSTRYAYPTLSARLAGARLRFAIDHQLGLALATGVSGAGKSTLLNTLAAQYRDDPTKTVARMPSLPDRGRAAAVKRIVTAFGQTPTTRRSYADSLEQLQAFVLSEAIAGRDCVLLLDEAQDIHGDVLSGVINDIINFRSSERTLITLVMFGLPTFVNKLRSPQMASFVSRIAMACQLEPLSPEELPLMIAHRLHVAGADIPPVQGEQAPDVSRWFSDEAIRVIYAATLGVPRDVCVLCNAAMLEARFRRVMCVDQDIATATVDNMKLHKLWPEATEEGATA